MATTVVVPSIETHHAHAGLSIAVTVISVLIIVLSVTDIVAAYKLQCVMGDPSIGDAIKAVPKTHVSGSEDKTPANKIKTARTINKVNLMISSFALIGAIVSAFVSVTTKEIELKIILLLVVSILAIVQGSLTFAGQSEYEDCVHSNFDKTVAGVSIGIGSLACIGMLVSMVRMKN